MTLVKITPPVVCGSLIGPAACPASPQAHLSVPDLLGDRLGIPEGEQGAWEGAPGGGTVGCSWGGCCGGTGAGEAQLVPRQLPSRPLSSWRSCGWELGLGYSHAR